MAIRIMSEVWESGPDRRTDLLVLLALADFADEGGMAYPNLPTLMEKCRISRQGLVNVLDRLEEEGWVRRIPGGGRGKSTHYWVRTVPRPPISAAKRVKHVDGLSPKRVNEVDGLSPKRVKHVDPFSEEKQSRSSGKNSQADKENSQEALGETVNPELTGTTKNHQGTVKNHHPRAQSSAQASAPSEPKGGGGGGEEKFTTKEDLVATLVAEGVSEKNAERLVEEHDPRAIVLQLKHYWHKRDQGWRSAPQSAGWIVTAVEEGYPLPQAVRQESTRQENTRQESTPARRSQSDDHSPEGRGSGDPSPENFQDLIDEAEQEARDRRSHSSTDPADG